MYLQQGHHTIVAFNQILIFAFLTSELGRRTDTLVEGRTAAMQVENIANMWKNIHFIVQCTNILGWSACKLNMSFAKVSIKYYLFVLTRLQCVQYLFKINVSNYVPYKLQTFMYMNIVLLVALFNVMYYPFIGQQIYTHYRFLDVAWS